MADISERVDSLVKAIPNVSKEVVERVVSNCDIHKWTHVQLETIGPFISHRDVVVQAATGSGKTLAFLVPTIHVLMNRKEAWNKWQIGAIILVPARELAHQVYEWACKINGSLVVQCFTGGTKTENDYDKFKREGCNIIIGTPGRLEELLTSEMGGHVRQLEVLVMDEADRLLDMGFHNSLCSIMNRLPKQRRTGLFSATQPKSVEGLIGTGLRNEVRITIDGHSEQVFDDVHAVNAVPLQLNNYYVVLQAEHKFAALVSFLLKNHGKKILVFFSTCACVDYFSKVLKAKLQCEVVALHGKQKNKRTKFFDKFKNMCDGVAVSTDVMARGIDLPDIDWVVQFDPPKQSQWFLHRSGRTGRNGREGNALLILNSSEEGYVQYLQSIESVDMKEYSLPVDEIFCEELRQYMMSIACKKREFLEAGSKAFVSYIESYRKHDCHIVCSIETLDVANVANSFALLRFPKMRELRAVDLTEFKRTDVDTSKIMYQDKTREKSRVKLHGEKIKEREERRIERLKSDVHSRGKKRKVKGGIDTSKKLRLNQEDVDDLNDDFKLMKKFKKGRLSKLEFESQFLDEK